MIAEVRKPRKIGNIDRILVKIVLSDAEFIVICVKTKHSKNQRLLAEKWLFSREYSKFSDFGPNAKGQFWPIFIAELRKPRKIEKTYQI